LDTGLVPNWIDAVILACAAYLMIRGWQVGIVKTLFRYLSILAGLTIALTYRNAFAEKLDGLELIQSEFWLHVLSFVLLFIVSAACIQILGLIISKLLRPTPLGLVDRMMGAGLGVVKTALICILVTYALTKIPERFSMHSSLRNSTVLTECRSLLPWLEKMYTNYNGKSLIPEKYIP
jgi:membrane protein required for colicin V production